MRALSIRQPYLEEILRGIKRIEYRAEPTGVNGEYESGNRSEGVLYGQLAMTGGLSGSV